MMTKTEASTATIQSATHTFKASGPYEGSADATSVPTVAFTLVRPVATAGGVLVPSLPNARGGSRLDETPDVPKCQASRLARLSDDQASTATSFLRGNGYAYPSIDCLPRDR